MKYILVGEGTRQQMIESVKQFYAEGHTTREIADKLCVSSSVVGSIKKTIDETENMK